MYRNEEVVELPSMGTEENAFMCTIKQVVKKGYTHFQRECETSGVKNLVFSGGGARGVAYAGVILALEKVMIGGTPMRSTIVSVSGSSAGAVTAALFATNLPASEFIKAAEEIDISRMIGGSFLERSMILGQSGTPFLNYVRERIITSICEFYTERKITGDLEINDEEHQATLVHLFTQFDPYPTCTGYPVEGYPRITFAHLGALHRLDPSKFKLLSVVAVDNQTGMKVVFSTSCNSDFEIALAVRASASIPGLMRPVIAYFQDGRELHLVDGGYADLVPVIEVVREEEQQEGYNVRKDGVSTSTMIFMFNEGYDETSDPSLKSKIFLDVLPRVFGFVKGNTRMTVAKHEAMLRIRNLYKSRVLALNVSGIGTMDFDKALENAKSLIDAAYEQTFAFIKKYNEENPSNSEENYNTIDELLFHLPLVKLYQFLELFQVENVSSILGITKEKADEIYRTRLRSIKATCRYNFGEGESERRWTYLLPCLGTDKSRRIQWDYPKRRIPSRRYSSVDYADGRGRIQCFEYTYLGRVFMGEYNDTEENIKELLEKGPVYDESEAVPPKSIESKDARSLSAVCSAIDSTKMFYEANRMYTDGVIDIYEENGK